MQPSGSYQVRQCIRETCRFRFPSPDPIRPEPDCPRCGGPTRPVDQPYHRRAVPAAGTAPRLPVIEGLLDNIRSVYNVGSMFRTADGVGIRHLHLCGITATPAHPKVAKTALGAEQAVPWTAHHNGVEAAAALKARGYRLWALEGGPGSQSLFEALPELDGPPIVLVVGNELAGVDPGILEQCDYILHLPMQGVKQSLNVVVAFGAAAYLLRWGFVLVDQSVVPGPSRP